MDHTEFSRKGGSSKSEKKRQAARDNVAKARERRLSKRSGTDSERSSCESSKKTENT
jgi:hypothetical protein